MKALLVALLLSIAPAAFAEPPFANPIGALFINPDPAICEFIIPSGLRVTKGGVGNDDILVRLNGTTAGFVEIDLVDVEDRILDWFIQAYSGSGLTKADFIDMGNLNCTNTRLFELVN